MPKIWSQLYFAIKNNLMKMIQFEFYSDHYNLFPIQDFNTNTKPYFTTTACFKVVCSVLWFVAGFKKITMLQILQLTQKLLFFFSAADLKRVSDCLRIIICQSHKIMKASTTLKSQQQTGQGNMTINRYQKLIKQPNKAAKNKKETSMGRRSNTAVSYIFNLKINKNDSVSIIHKHSNLLAKKYIAHHNKTEIKDKRGTTPFQERKMLQKKNNQQKIVKSRKSQGQEYSFNFLQAKWLKISEVLGLQAKREQKLQQSNIRQTQSSAKDLIESNFLTISQQSYLNPVSQDVSNLAHLNKNRASIGVDKIANENIKVSFKHLVKANRSSSYKKRLLKTNQCEILKSIKVQAKERIPTQSRLSKDEKSKHFFWNDTRKERHLRSKSKIKSHIRHSKTPLSFMEEFITSAISIKPSNFEEKSVSFSSKQIQSRLSSKDNQINMHPVQSSSGSALNKHLHKSKRDKSLISKPQVKQITGWQSSNDFSQRQCFF